MKSKKVSKYDKEGKGKKCSIDFFKNKCQICKRKYTNKKNILEK